MNIHYLIGDATEPQNKPALICHVNNDVGGWGRGFVLALSKKDPRPEQYYRNWYKNRKSSCPEFKLGAIQIVPFVDDTMKVANMIAQKDTHPHNNIPPIRYEALKKCLTSAYHYASSNNMSISMPRIGCVLAGGDWSEVEKILKEVMTVETYVYTLPNEKNNWGENYENTYNQDSDSDIEIKSLSDLF